VTGIVGFGSRRKKGTWQRVPKDKKNDDPLVDGFHI
jgi:hypothetical protein